MKHNQTDDASNKQNEKGASHQKQTPKNQDSSNNGKSAQHSQSSRDKSDEDDQQSGKQGSKKHAETGKSK